MNHKSHIASWLKSTLSAAPFSCEFEESEIERFIERPKDEKMGDYAFPCFILSKPLKKPPVKISPLVVEELNKSMDEKIFQSIEAAGPYVNFKLQTSALAESVLPEILQGRFTDTRESKNEKVMIEYSQPNTHKAFHVGHTRNVALGDALVRIYEWSGFDVTAVNYIGDVGTHIAKCLWYFKKHYKGEVPETNRGEFLGDLYVKATDMLDFKLLTQAPHIGILSAEVKSIEPHPNNEKWQVATVALPNSEHTLVCGGTGYSVGDIVAYAPVGSKVSGREVLKVDKAGVTSDGVICSEKEISIGSEKNKIFVFPAGTQLGEEIANLLQVDGVTLEQPTVVEEMQSRTEQVSQTLKAIEGNDPEMAKLWEETKQWSMDEFYKIYSWLNARFDHYFYESDVAEPGKEIVKEYLEKEVFEYSEGAVGTNLENFKLPFFLVLKSDGTGLYSTKDLALARMKFDQYNIDRNIYVVDDGQSLHFKQVFATLQLMGFKNAEKCYHLAYGKVERPDGKMSSRKGNVILFSQLKNILTEKITSEFLEKYRGDWSDEEIEQAAHRIAVATIKYGMLNQDSAKNIVFDLDEWTARTGNTGPYLMYAYARTQSILKEVDGTAANLKLEPNALKEDAEHQLLVKLSQFHEVVEKSVLRNEPQLICIYLYGLAKQFSGFYSQCPVLKAENESLKNARLALVDATGRILDRGLGLLGIQSLNKM